MDRYLAGYGDSLASATEAFREREGCEAWGREAAEEFRRKAFGFEYECRKNDQRVKRKVWSERDTMENKADGTVDKTADKTQGGTGDERAEIRPHMRLGLILIGIGGLNALTGASSRLLNAVHADTPTAIWIDKLFFIAIIALGIWISRKKIVLEAGSARFFGLVSGNSRAEIRLADIESADYAPSKRGLEIKAKGAVLAVRLRPGSKAAEELLQALKVRGVTVAPRDHFREL